MVLAFYKVLTIYNLKKLEQVHGKQQGVVLYDAIYQEAPFSARQYTVFRCAQFLRISLIFAPSYFRLHKQFSCSIARALLHVFFLLVKTSY